MARARLNVDFSEEKKQQQLTCPLDVLLAEPDETGSTEDSYRPDLLTSTPAISSKTTALVLAVDDVDTDDDNEEAEDVDIQDVVLGRLLLFSEEKTHTHTD
jgi:hypothetical protein